MIPSSLRGSLFVLAGALCFSSTGFTQALIAPYDASPFLVGGTRMLVACAALFLLCAWRGRLPSRTGWPIKNVLLCTLGILGNQVFFFTGVLHTGVALGTVVSLGFVPVSAALLAWLVLKEKPQRAWYPATALAILGLILLNGGGTGGVPMQALLAPLAAGACYALYLVYSKPLTRTHTEESIMLVLFFLCGLCLLPFFFIYPTAWLGTPTGLTAALHLGVITAAAAYCLTLTGLKLTPAATASTLGLAEPFGAALLGICCLGEQISYQGLAGMACILGSAVFIIVIPHMAFLHSKKF